MAILVTGGTGFIGSHTSVELLEAGYDIIIVDNLSNSKDKVIEELTNITGRTVKFYNIDLLDRYNLDRVFANHQIEAVIHLAGSKAVFESVENPLKYYENNIIGTIILLDIMKKHNIKKIIFSSSATIYGEPMRVPITEEFPIKPINPYGRTKYMIEEILKDLYNSDPGWGVVILRYFNPLGAHGSGRIGDDPMGIPNNLMPYITQVASGKLKRLYIYGNDYNTHDGTGVRDYVHVVDLARGHLYSLHKIMRDSGISIYNIGTGIGYSVLDIVLTFERVNRVEIPYIYTERRVGDVDKVYCDPGKIMRELGWKAEKNLEDMCIDSWSWEKNKSSN